MKIGDTAYFKSANSWYFGLFKGTFTGEVIFVKEENKKLYTFKSVERIIDDESEYEYGEFKAFEDMIFPTYEQLVSYLDAQRKQQIETYCNSIKTLNDLLKFPLENCISNGEEYVDWIAREAYIKRAKDFGLEYNNN